MHTQLNYKLWRRISKWIQSSESNGLVDYSDPYPADSEQFMLIEELYKQTDKQQEWIDGILHNEVNINALEKAVDKLQSDVEKLKDKQREFGNGNSH